MAKNKRPRRILRGLMYLLSLLVAAALCYVGVLMLTGHFDGLSQPEAATVSPLDAGQTTNVSALASAFGAPVPCLPGYAMQGQALNTLYNGRTVRKAILQYDGFTITCVQPAFASPLLLNSRLSLSMETDLTVAGLPAALAENGDARCLYFSTDTAAYSLYAPSAGRDTFLALAAKITLSE